MNTKEFFNFLIETFKMAVLAFLVVLPIRYFLFQPFIVSGSSMHPNFENGDYLLVDEISFRLREPQRGEVVVFRAPVQPSTRYIKRIIGLPKETIEITNGNIVIGKENGESQILDESRYLPNANSVLGEIRISLAENEYFVLGDNRRFSSDSRAWGVLPRNNIIGRAFFRAWPFNTFALIERPAYSL